MVQSMANTVLNAPAHSEKSQTRLLRNHFLSQIFGILELIIILSFNFTICLIFICGTLFLLIVFHIPLCNVRQPYTGCPFTCNLAEIRRNETVWRMRINNVKGVYYHLMQVKSIAECSKGSILQYFRPSLGYHLSLRFLFCLFLSGCLRQVLLYVQNYNKGPIL